MVTMPEASAIVYECPACGRPIEPGEDYVVHASTRHRPTSACT